MVSSTVPITKEAQPVQRVHKLHQIHQKISQILEDGKQKNTIASLDGVRAFACLAVLFFHLNFFARETHVWVPIHDFGSAIGAIMLAGQSGVTLFFVLSGFLLFMPYAKSLLFHTPWPSLRTFYLRRAFRIIPAYYVILFILILWQHREYLQPQHLQELGLFMTFFMDMPITYQKLNGPFWTLAVEAQFYMWLPLIAFGISLIVRRGVLAWRLVSLVLCLVGLVIWGLASRYWGYELLWNPTHTIFNLPRSFINAILPFAYGSSGKYMEDFAIGMLASCGYIYAQSTPKHNWWNAFVRNISPLLFIVGLGILFFMALWHFNIWYYHYALHPFDPLINYYAQWSEVCLALGFGLCMFAILFGPPLLKRPFEWSVLRWIGLISYSLYMIHVPLLSYFSDHVIKHLHQTHRLLEYGLFVFWAALVIIPLSLLSYVLIEKRFMRLGEKVRRFIDKKPPVVQRSHVQADEGRVADHKLSLAHGHSEQKR